jgi:co-chaperonin GroES (HSP10)
MIKPRNTFVLVRLILKPEEQVGKIVVPTGQDEYTEGEILAVGEGIIDAAGGQSGTHDLKVGQRVLVRHRRKMERPSQVGNGTVVGYVSEGLRLRASDAEGDVYLFGQENLLAIVGE